MNDPNSNDESSPSGLDRREETMKESNDEDKTEQSITVCHSRRDFIVLAATTVASVGAANLLNVQSAQGADTKNSVAIGNGPYPAEGVAAYSQTGPPQTHEVPASRSWSQRRSY